MHVMKQVRNIVTLYVVFVLLNNTIIYVFLSWYERADTQHLNMIRL